MQVLCTRARKTAVAGFDFANFAPARPDEPVGIKIGRRNVSLGLTKNVVRLKGSAEIGNMKKKSVQGGQQVLLFPDWSMPSLTIQKAS